MNEIGLFVSSFGGMGLFIYYLLNRDKTVSKEQTEAIKRVGEKLDKVIDSNDDLTIAILDVLDFLVPDYGKKRNNKSLKVRVEKRRLREDQPI